MRLILLAPALLLLTAAASPPPPYDLVIRNGRVIDGSGSPWVREDVAIKNGRIVRIGLIAGKGAKEIDARDRYVTPGFIDMMDHSGAIFLKGADAENKLREGVTTVIDGEGGTPVPADQIGGFFDRLQSQGIPLNFGTYYSTMQARQKVMGDVAGTPNEAQLAVMRKEVDTAMHAGVFGISTALMYSPQMFQSTSDLIDLAKVASKCDAIYSSHIRDESQSLVSSIQEAVKIGEEGGVKVEIYHLKAAYRPEFGKLMPQAVATINAARARGVDIAADMYVYTAAGTGIDATVPTWVWKEGKQKAVERLGDPAVRVRLKKELAGPSTPEWQNLVASSGGWDHIILANSYNPAYKKYEGKSFAEIGAALAKDPADVAWDVLIAAMPNRAYALYQMIGEEDIRTALAQPWVSIGSDAASAAKAGQLDGIGLPHPRSYGNFARVIEQYVEKEHVLTLEEAVRKMAGWPSARMGLGDRGVIREGMYADLLVFDPSKVRENATYDHPTVLASGFDDVVVNGVVTIDEGNFIPAKSGMVLRHACPAG